MNASDMQAIQRRWTAIIDAMMVAGIPRDDLSILAIIAGAQRLEQRFTQTRETRPIGFAPAQRKESE